MCHAYWSEVEQRYVVLYHTLKEMCLQSEDHTSNLGKTIGRNSTNLFIRDRYKHWTTIGYKLTMFLGLF